MRYKVGDSVKLKSGLTAVIEMCDDKYYYVKDSNGNHKKIALVKDASNGEIEGFLKKGVEFMMNNQEYTLKCLNLNSQLCLALYWESGYGNKLRDDVMQAEDLDWALNAGIKVRNPSESDGAYLKFPCNPDGNPYCESISIVPNENYAKLAGYINGQFEQLKDLTFDDDGIEEVKEAEVVEDAIPYGVFAWKLNEIISSMNDEGAYYDSEWLYIWPDGETKQEAIEDFSDKEAYVELEETFESVYRYYHEGGLYTADPEIIELAHKYDEKYGLDPIDVISPVKGNDAVKHDFDYYKDWYKKEDGWTEEDIELHKSIDWKARNFEDYEIKNDQIITKAYCYRMNKDTETKPVKMSRYLRANGIFSPYYGLASGEKEPFDDVVGPMYDGRKKNGYDIMDRYESQEVYDLMFDSAPESPATDYASIRNSLISADNEDALNVAKNTFEDLFKKGLINSVDYHKLKKAYSNKHNSIKDNMATLTAPLCKEGKCAEPICDSDDEDEQINKYTNQRQGSDNDDEIPTYDMELEGYEPEENDDYYEESDYEAENTPKGYNIIFLEAGGSEYKTIHYNDADEAYHDYEYMCKGVPVEYEDVIIETEW